MAKSNRIETYENRIERSETKIEALKRQMKEEQDKLKAQEQALKVERYDRILNKFWELEIENEDQIEQLIEEFIVSLQKENLLEEEMQAEQENEVEGIYDGTR